MLELYLTYLILLGAAQLLFQLSQLATAIVVGGALMAYVHSKDLASAWLKSFFGLDVQIKGELTWVEWRAGTNTAPRAAFSTTKNTIYTNNTKSEIQRWREPHLQDHVSDSRRSESTRRRRLARKQKNVYRWTL